MIFIASLKYIVTLLGKSSIFMDVEVSVLCKSNVYQLCTWSCFILSGTFYSVKQKQSFIEDTDVLSTQQFA